MTVARKASREARHQPISGWVALPVWVLYVATLVWRIVEAGTHGASPGGVLLLCLGVGLALLALPGFFIVNPNMSRALVLFGRYRGTVRTEGFHWTNPFTVKRHVSLRAHNQASQKIKVNDLVGNPIEIGAVIVWQIRDTAQALFDVQDYAQYVDVQIETAVRQLARSHPYDDTFDGEVASLRGDDAQVNEELQEGLQVRLDRAGVEVLEARISHLAYAPEIAAAMLQRQQASAVIAAREKIVEGAVHIVKDALRHLAEGSVIELDDERRAALVGNLLVVLCGHSAPTPILNTGTLYP